MLAAEGNRIMNLKTAVSSHAKSNKFLYLTKSENVLDEENGIYAQEHFSSFITSKWR